MASKNEITGDTISTKGAATDAYRDGWDRIYGKKTKPAEIDRVWIDEMRDVVWPESEDRMDVIGQNGNDGDHYPGSSLPGDSNSEIKHQAP